MGNPRGIRRNFNELEKRRFAAESLLAAGFHQSEVARRLNVHRQSVSRWNAARKKGGRDALRKAGRAGRRPRLSLAQKEDIKATLATGGKAQTDSKVRWTIRRFVALIHEKTGIRYHKGHAWKLLRKLGRISLSPRTKSF